MVTIGELAIKLFEFLDAAAVKDSCPNGLQVEGRREIRRIVTGVSACMELFDAAKEKGADAIIVHHGLFWDSGERVIRGSMRDRVKFLLENDISLLAYHLPLDRHPEVGNNALIAKALGLADAKLFGDYGGKPIGYSGMLAEPVPIAKFMETVRSAINPSARLHEFGPAAVGKVAVCSGGCQQLFHQAIKDGASLFLTGEDSEWIYHLAREENIHYVAAGHHATERFGPRALGEWVESTMGVPAEFVDIPNPL
jgi:dinuclear metal center YbgI/SA1388 family protein